MDVPFCAVPFCAQLYCGYHGRPRRTIVWAILGKLRLSILVPSGKTKRDWVGLSPVCFTSSPVCLSPHLLASSRRLCDLGSTFCRPWASVALVRSLSLASHGGISARTDLVARSAPQAVGSNRLLAPAM